MRPPLLTGLRESFALLSRNLVLVYPVIFFFLVVDLVIPRSAGLPSFDIRWILSITLFLLLFSAFTAGWFAMVAEAVRRFREPAKPVAAGVAPEISLFSESFTLFKSFLPGIGDHFLRFVLGWLIFFAVLAGILWAVHHGIETGGGYPPVLEKLRGVLAKGPESQAELKAFEAALTDPEKAQLAAVASRYSGASLVFFLFALMTVFWAPLTLLRQETVLRAYGRSLRLFFRNPLGLLGLGALYYALFMGITLLGGLHPFLAILSMFCWLFVDIGLVIFLFLYVTDSFAQKPEVPVSGGGPSSPAASSGPRKGEDPAPPAGS